MSTVFFSNHLFVSRLACAQISVILSGASVGMAGFCIQLIEIKLLSSLKLIGFIISLTTVFALMFTDTRNPLRLFPTCATPD